FLHSVARVRAAKLQSTPEPSDAQTGDNHSCARVRYCHVADSLCGLGFAAAHVCPRTHVCGQGGFATSASDLLPSGLCEAAVAGVTGLFRLLRGFHPAPPSAAWALLARVHLVTDISGHGALPPTTCPPLPRPALRASPGATAGSPPHKGGRDDSRQ